MENVVMVGRILKPHGVKGEVKVIPLTDFADERFQRNAHFVFENGSEIIIENVRTQGNIFLIKFKGIKDRDEAAGLSGEELFISADLMPDLPEDTFWMDDLIDCEVLDKEGRPAGKVKDILQTPANDVLVVSRGENKEILLPLIKDFIKEVDIPAKRIKIDYLPEE